MGSESLGVRNFAGEEGVSVKPSRVANENPP